MEFNSKVLVNDQFKGVYQGSGRMFVDGTFEGTLMIDEVIVGVTGKFLGKLVAKLIIIEGIVNADIETEKIHIKSNGQMQGELIYRDLIIEEGGFLNSTKVMKMSSFKSIKNLISASRNKK